MLLEPTSIVEKGIEQAYEIQRRLRIWRPARAAVAGAGTLGLLATLVLRLRGLEVTTLARTEPPTLNSELVEALGAARYESTPVLPRLEATERHGLFDLIFEATGASSVVCTAVDNAADVSGSVSRRMASPRCDVKLYREVLERA